MAEGNERIGIAGEDLSAASNLGLAVYTNPSDADKVMKRVTLGVGINPLTIQFKTGSGGNLVEIKNARISAQGAYE